MQQAPVPSNPPPQADAAQDSRSAAEQLLQLEGQARHISSIDELQCFMANESRKLVTYRQAIVLSRKSAKKFAVNSISSLAMVDGHSPFVHWIEQITSGLINDVDSTQIREFSLAGYSDTDSAQLKEYPFLAALWVPLLDQESQVFGALLLTSEKPWQASQITVCQRLADCYSHAWRALQKHPRSWRSRVRSAKKIGVIGALLCLGAMFLPVPLTTLAPAEVVAAAPLISSAPINGVITELFVDPNHAVEKGQLLYKFEDTDLRNQYDIADQQVHVAAAKLKRARQSAFDSAKDAHNIAIFEAELSRSELERDYAKEQLGLIEVRSTIRGIALYNDKNDWIGKPVVVGEEVMRIANPSNIKFLFEVPVKDSINLVPNAQARVYLDADPLQPIETDITTSSYRAVELPGQKLGYKVTAQLRTTADTKPRIGQRGTAKIYGEQTSLFFYLFRRPITAVRQYLGI